jgi:hypothetical protein
MTSAATPSQLREYGPGNETSQDRLYDNDRRFVQ